MSHHHYTKDVQTCSKNVSPLKTNFLVSRVKIQNSKKQDSFERHLKTEKIDQTVYRLLTALETGSCDRKNKHCSYL